MRGRGRVELVETQVTPCSDFRDHVPVRRYEVRRTAQWPPLAGPARGRTLAAGSPLSCAVPGGFGIGPPAQGRHSRSARWSSQPLSTGARYSWSAVHMHHRGGRIRCDIITSRAGQLEMCGAALLGLQDHRVLSSGRPHAAWEMCRRRQWLTGVNGRLRPCRSFPTSPVQSKVTGSQRALV